MRIIPSVSSLSEQERLAFEKKYSLVVGQPMVSRDGTVTKHIYEGEVGIHRIQKYVRVNGKWVSFGRIRNNSYHIKEPKPIRVRYVKKIKICIVCKICPAARPSSYCVPCRKEQGKRWRERNQERHNANLKAWRKKNPERRREYELRRVHDLGKDDYDSALVEQGGVCEICKQPPVSGKVLHIDHNHRTNQIRSLLCQHCNQGLGHFKENVNSLLAAIRYINFWQSLEVPISA